MAFSVLKLLITAGIVVAGLTLAWVYVRNPDCGIKVRHAADCGRRPWRRLGGAICLLLAVMFPLGVYVVDVPDHPRVYAAYWVLIMALVLWLTALATKDMLYTRALVKRWRSATPNSLGLRGDGVETTEGGSER